MLSPHGIPVDLLDRLVIIRTLQYVLEEIIAILNTRAKVSPPRPPPPAGNVAVDTALNICHMSCLFRGGLLFYAVPLVASLTCNLFW